MSRLKVATKKPIDVEVMQFIDDLDNFEHGVTDVIDWVLENGGTARYECNELNNVGRCAAKGHHLIIETLEGPMRADSKWWIARGVEGEFYPIKPSVFEKSYSINEELSEGA